MQYPDARFSLFIALTFCFQIGIKYEAVDVMLDFISRLSAGKTPATFGYTSDAKGNQFLTTASTRYPKTFMALQYVVKNIFRISDVIAVRLGRGINNTQLAPFAKGCTLVYYERDTEPDFKFYESEDTAIDVMSVTNITKSKIIQCLTGKAPKQLKTCDDLAGNLMPDNRDRTTPQEPPQDATATRAQVERQDDLRRAEAEGRLDSIAEESEEDSLLMQQLYD